VRRSKKRRVEEEADEHHGEFDANCVVVPYPNPSPAPARRSKKRRVEEEADEHHGEFDANALREHEEYTKVKNVEVVELGRHTMETWYFSPLPAEYSNCKARRAAPPDPHPACGVWRSCEARRGPELSRPDACASAVGSAEVCECPSMCGWPCQPALRAELSFNAASAIVRCMSGRLRTS